MKSIHVDSCAFDPKYDPEDKAADEIYRLYETGEIFLQLAHSTQKEIEHPNTPSHVKDLASTLIFTMETALTQRERDLSQNILSILAGNGSPDNVQQDASYIFEAQKYCCPFITTDGRILKKSEELFSVCHVLILKPTEYLSRIEKQRR